MTIIITGGVGFIGSNFVFYMLAKFIISGEYQNYYEMMYGNNDIIKNNFNL